jgi:uncharacterized protein
MPHDDYRRAIAEYIRTEALPPDKFSHQPRLYQLARRLGEGCVFDDDVLYAAAWIHDVGVFLGHRPKDPAQLAAWDNVAYAVRVAPELLRSLGFPEEKAAAAAEAIRTHLPSGRPTSTEGVLLRDADILEQLGAIGIVRMISKVGRDTRYPTHTEAIRVLQANARNLPARLEMPLARAMAAQRIELMSAFFAELHAEAPD